MAKLIESWLDQIKDLARSLWPAYLLVIILLGAIIILKLFSNIPIGYFTRDPADIMRHSQIFRFSFCEDGIVNLPFYLGGLSYIGISLWCATMTICFFSFLILRRTAQTIPAPSFFLLAGLISTLLFLDDLFRLHEIVFPVYLHLHEYTLYATHVILVSLFLIGCRRTILDTQYLLLLLACGCFALSLSADVISDMFFRSISGESFFEDGLKFIGIVSWFAYFSRVALLHIIKLVKREHVQI